MQTYKQMSGSFLFRLTVSFFFCSSATLSTLTCQVSYKLAFQSQTPRAESPDQTFLWKFLLKQLGKSQQNKQIFLCADRVLGHIPLSTFICGWVYPSEQPQWFQWSHNHTQITHATNPCWINKSGLLATHSTVMQQVALQHHTHWKTTQQGQVYWCSNFYIFFRK